MQAVMRFRPELTAMFDTEGVLPLADPLPRYSTKEDFMPLSHQAWMNNFLARFIVFCEVQSSERKHPSMQQFCRQLDANNSPDALRNLGGIIADVSGVKYKRKHEQDYAPRSLTALGAYQVEKRWAEMTKSKPTKAQALGQAMIDQDLLAYEPETETVIPVEDIISDE